MRWGSRIAIAAPGPCEAKNEIRKIGKQENAELLALTPAPSLPAFLIRILSPPISSLPDLKNQPPMNTDETLIKQSPLAPSSRTAQTVRDLADAIAVSAGNRSRLRHCTPVPGSTTATASARSFAVCAAQDDAGSRARSQNAGAKIHRRDLIALRRVSAIFRCRFSVAIHHIAAASCHFSVVRWNGNAPRCL